MTEYEPLTPDHDAVVATEPDGITIGSDGMGHVHLSPESAPVQTARLVHLLTSEDIETPLWGGGYTRDNWETTYEDILILRRWEYSLGSGTDVYAYSVLFGDNIDPEYIDDVKRHARLETSPMQTRATR